MPTLYPRTSNTISAQFHECDDERDAFETLLQNLVVNCDAASVWTWKQSGDQYHLHCKTHSTTEIDPISDFENEDGLQEHFRRVVSKANPVGFSKDGMVNFKKFTTQIYFSAVTWKGQCYIIGISFPPDGSPTERKFATIKLLSELANWNCDKSSELSASFPEASRNERAIDCAQSSGTMHPVSLSDYVHGINNSLSLADTENRIANETRRFLQCDRVSVLTVTGGRLKIEAISGQPGVNKRSDLVLSLEKLATVALRTKTEFHYPNIGSSIPPQIERVLEHYLSISNSREILVLPVFELTNENETIKVATFSETLVGGIVIEFIRSGLPIEDSDRKVRLVCLHAGDALRNSLQHPKSVQKSLAKLISKSISTAQKKFRITFILGIAILLSIVALFTVQSETTTRVRGNLIPKVRRNVFSEIDGEVNKVQVTQGQRVRAGDTLLTMKSDDLDSRVLDVTGRLTTLLQRIKVLELSGLATSRGDSHRGPSLMNNLSSLRAEAENLEEQQNTLLKLKEKLTITSPIDGLVLTWDPHQRLQGRPIRIGELLIEVAESDGRWQIELLIPENRVGKVLNAIQDRSIPLPISLVLASHPGMRYEGLLKEVSSTSQICPDRTNAVRAIAEFKGPSPEVDFRQVRSGVVAKIYCGRASLAKSLFGDIIDFVESEIIFRIW